MINREMGVVLRKLTAFGLYLNAVIDSGMHSEVSKDEVGTRIDDKTIFRFLEERFQSVSHWGLTGFTDEERRRLIGEWQSMANATLSEEDLGVGRSGICLLLAYVFSGIEMRTLSGKIWPGPEPV